jgi:hypothetical protein|tara:strand:- start:161 stop:373 length:213 start_codon:yes stop_codon:yes gene_type:complete
MKVKDFKDELKAIVAEEVKQKAMDKKAAKKLARMRPSDFVVFMDDGFDAHMEMGVGYSYNEGSSYDSEWN